MQIDVRVTLKKCKKVKKSGSDSITCNFQYEKLPSFCFICGLIGRIDRQCEIRFRVPKNELVRNWDVSLRAQNIWTSNLGDERWLLEEDGGDGTSRVTGQ